MNSLDFNHDFNAEKKLVRVFTILEGAGALLTLLLLLFSAPRAWMIALALLMVAAAAGIGILLRRRYLALPVVREKQPMLDENAKLQAQVKQYEHTLSNESKARDQIRQEEKRAADKCRADHDAALARYKTQHAQVDQKEREEIAMHLKKMQREFIQQGLKSARIADASISGIAPKMKEKLAGAGIVTADQVDLARIQNIQGFGEKKAQAVVSWRRDVEQKLEREKPRDIPNPLAKAVHAKYEIQHHQIEGQEQAAQERLPGDLEKIGQQEAGRQAQYDQAVAEARECLPSLKPQAARVVQILEQYKAITFWAFLNRSLGAGGGPGSFRQRAGAYALGVFLVAAPLIQLASGGLSSAMMVVDAIPTFTLTPAATSTPTITATFTLVPTTTNAPTFTLVPTTTNSPTFVPTETLAPSLTPTTTLTPTITPTPTQTLIPTNTLAPTAWVGFELDELSSPVYSGSSASASIKTKPGADCRIVVILPSGRSSTAQGLEAQQASDDGVCSWFWKIQGNTKAGTGSITITANGTSKTFAFIIQ